MSAAEPAGGAAPWSPPLAALMTLAIAGGAITSFVMPSGAGPRHPLVADFSTQAAAAAVQEDIASGRPHAGEDEARLDQIARARPLAALPYTVAGLLAAGDGRYAKADRLVAEAIRRDPRSELAYSYRLGRALALRRGREAARLTLILLALAPSAAPTLVPLLVQLTADPGARGVLQTALAREPDPSWRSQYLDALRRSGADPALVYQMLGGRGRALSAREAADFQGGLLDTLIAQSQFDRAYVGWIALLPPEALAQVTPVYDETFRGLPGPPPFNWSYAQTGEGSAVPNPGRGLAVEFTGQSAVRLAREIVLLGPGRYRFAVAMTMAGTAGGALSPPALAWSVRCLPGGATIATLRGGGAATFAVPQAGCAAQEVRLDGEASDDGAIADATVQRVSIEPAR